MTPDPPVIKLEKHAYGGSALGRLPEPEMPEEVQREMLAHFRNWRRTTQTGEPGAGGVPESGPPS